MVALLEWAHWKRSPKVDWCADFDDETPQKFYSIGAFINSYTIDQDEPPVVMKPPGWIKALADLNFTAEEVKSMLSDSPEPMDLVNKPIVFDGEEFKFKEDAE